MQGNKFMQQANGGMIQIDCMNMPDKAFVDANIIRDVYRIKMYRRDARGEGLNDVELISISGTRKMIHRSDLVNNFVYTNGNKIKIYHLKYDKHYLVQSVKPVDKYKVCKLPKNCYGILNGKKVAPGNYIVGKVDDSGQLDRSTIGVVKATTFKKVFSIPMQDKISRALTIKSDAFTLFDRPRNSIQGRISKSISNSVGAPVTPSGNIGLSKPTLSKGNITIAKNNIQNKPNLTIDKEDNTNKYQFKAINRILDYNNKLIGFVVEDNSGKRKSLTIPEVTQLCNRKLISNLMLVSKADTGLKFLKGNGIKINDLPSVVN